jgi:hypothetical protein
LALNPSNYDFIKYPTLKLSFIDLTWSSVSELQHDLYNRVRIEAESFGITVDECLKSPSSALIELVRKLKDKTGKQIVILVDEYDCPILDDLENTKAAMDNANVLGGFFGTVKNLDNDGYMRFTFVAGVSKFSMTSIFSGANVFTDISEDEEFANICGITYEEFDKRIKNSIHEMFAEGLFKETEYKNGESFIQSLEDMYDGYTWNSIDRIFNPFSLLKAVQNQELDSYWFDSGAPTFLYEHIESNPQKALFLDGITMPREYLKNQTAADLSLVPLLYQSGYLTSSLPVKNGVYTLKIPNIEVKNALNYLLTKTFVDEKLGDFYTFGSELLEAFKENDESRIQDRLTVLFLNIKLKRDEFCERTFHVAILYFLRLVRVKTVYFELNIAGGGIDICFEPDDDKAILLELKSLDHSHFHKTDTDLDVIFAESLDEAEKRLNKYYVPLFTKIKAHEIQGIAMSTAWRRGIRVRISKKVTRGMTQQDVDNMPLKGFVRNMM